MSGVWDQIKRLFNQVEKSDSNQPVVHEIIQRSNLEQNFLSQFKLGITFRQILDWIRDEYKVRPQNKSGNKKDHLQFVKTKGLSGFIIFFNQTNYTQEETIAFFDSLKAKILEENYVSYVSDSRAFVKDGNKEEVQRHYLKPSLRKSTEKLLPQLFGNINIELVLKNNKTQYLKFVATHYKDHLFQEVVPFEQLINFITK